MVAGGDVVVDVVVVVVGVVVWSGKAPFVASFAASGGNSATMAMSAGPPATAMMQRRLRLEVVLTIL